jgi:hypothetical protein
MFSDDAKYASRARVDFSFAGARCDRISCGRLSPSWRPARDECDLRCAVPSIITRSASQRLRKQLLATIPGVEYRPLEGMQDCWRWRRIYNLTEPEMSERLLEDKITRVRATARICWLRANPGLPYAAWSGCPAFWCELQRRARYRAYR